MTSFYAKELSDPPDPMNVVFVVYPDIVLLDLAGPLQVFTHARKDPLSKPAYTTSVISCQGGAIKTNTVLQIDSDPFTDWLEAQPNTFIHTLVVIGGDGAIPAALDPPLVQQIRQLAARSARVCSVCSGAFVLAAAGLLEGRRAVTHWEDCDHLARAYPSVKVEVDPIYIKEGNIWTSAGITAGIDMALAIIEEDLGKPAAIAMARSLVTPMVRSGGQSQFSQELDRLASDTNGQFSGLHDWIADHIEQRITVEDMANECGMSPRNFSRRYSETMGISPAKAIEAMRVDAARDLLTATHRSVQTIAAVCGFKDDERMRRAFLRHINTTPSGYRKQFQLGHPAKTGGAFAPAQ